MDDVTSMDAEGEMDSNESTTVPYTSEVPEGSEDGEVKRDDTTLLERSLSASSMSRSFDSQGNDTVLRLPAIIRMKVSIASDKQIYCCVRYFMNKM